jgi:hypothetical protein
MYLTHIRELAHHPDFCHLVHHTHREQPFATTSCPLLGYTQMVSSRRAACVDLVPALSEDEMRRLEQADDEQDDGLPPSLISDRCDVDDHFQGLAGALAQLNIPELLRLRTTEAACAI